MTEVEGQLPLPGILAPEGAPQEAQSSGPGVVLVQFGYLRKGADMSEAVGMNLMQIVIPNLPAAVQLVISLISIIQQVLEKMAAALKGKPGIYMPDGSRHLLPPSGEEPAGGEDPAGEMQNA